jgi:hypothetical protein
VIIAIPTKIRALTKNHETVEMEITAIMKGIAKVKETVVRNEIVVANK